MRPLRPLHRAWTPFLLSLLWLGVAACAPKEGARSPRRDPSAVVEQQRDAPAPFALQARFDITVKGPATGGSTKGGLVMHAPDRLRVEILTPLGTPFYTLATDGRALHVWSPRDTTFYRGDDALVVLGALSGGAVSPADLLSIFMARLPLPEAPLLSAVAVDRDVAVVLGAPKVPGCAEGGAAAGLRCEDLRLRALLDPRKDVVLSLELGRSGPDGGLELAETFATVTYSDFRRVGRAWLPEGLVVSLPSLGWTLEVEVNAWDELGAIPDAFGLVPPPGAVQKSLVETLTRLAEQRKAP